MVYVSLVNNNLDKDPHDQAINSGSWYAPMVDNIDHYSSTVSTTMKQVKLVDDKISGKVSSVATGITGATAITNIVSITAAGYAAITKSSTTLYIIVG